MQRYAIIGLGRFGSRLARNLAQAGHEVIAIDRDEKMVEKVRDHVTLAVELDATDEQALRAQGVDQCDAVVVGIGQDFESSALATVLLKQIGVPKVISRAVSNTSARILKNIGADAVVKPEDEAADRWAARLMSPQFLSMFELDEDHAIVEMPTPPSWVGKTLIDLKLRATYGLHVVAIKTPDSNKPDAPAHVHVPRPDHPLAQGDTLVIMGKDDDLAKLRE